MAAFEVRVDGATDADLGHMLQAPEVGVLADGRWVVVTGNGYESRSKRAKLLVVDLVTGQVLAWLDTQVGSDQQPNGLGGVRLIRDGNRVITGAYARDLRAISGSSIWPRPGRATGRCPTAARRCSAPTGSDRSWCRRPW